MINFCADFPSLNLHLLLYREGLLLMLACGLNPTLNYAQPRNDSSHLIKSWLAASRISHICCKSIIMNVPSSVYGAFLLLLLFYCCSSLSKELLIQDITLTNLDQKVTNSKFQMHQGRMLTIAEEDLQQHPPTLRFLL